MKKELVYLKLELKKGMKVFTGAWLTFVILMVLLLVGIMAISHFALKSQAFSVLEVGMVIPPEETETRMATRLASSMESVASICQFQYMDKEAAIQKMEQGELQIVVEFPDHFFEEVNSGINPPAIVYFPDNSTVYTDVFRETVIDGVSLLQTAESGVYAAYDLAQIYPLKVAYSELGNELARIYAEQALKRGRLFQSVVKSAWGDMDLLQFYVAVAITVFLLLSGLNYGSFYEKQSQILEEKLRIYGLRSEVFSLSKILTMTLLLWITSLLGYFFSVFLSSQMEGATVMMEVSPILGMIPVCFSIAAFFHMIYQASNRSTQGVMVVLLFSLGMILCGGILIPAAFLPSGFQILSRFLPIQYWNYYLAKNLFMGITFGDMMWVVGIGILEIGIGELLVCRKS